MVHCCSLHSTRWPVSKIIFRFAPSSSLAPSSSERLACRYMHAGNLQCPTDLFVPAHSGKPDRGVLAFETFGRVSASSVRIAPIRAGPFLPHQRNCDRKSVVQGKRVDLG